MTEVLSYQIGLLIGKCNSGKTKLMQRMLDHQIPAMDMEWDYVTRYSSTGEEDPDVIQGNSYSEIYDMDESFPNMFPKHAVVWMDDPPPKAKTNKKYYTAANYLFCNGRHRGYSAFICCQDPSGYV